LADRKGGARASKFLKTVGRGSQVSRGPQEVGEGVEKAAGDSPEAAESVQPPTTRVELEARPGEETTRGVRGGRKRAGGRTRPEKPIRITVDLDAQRHRFLRDDAHRRETKGTAVVRALLDELRDDAELSDRVVSRLENP